MVGAHYDSVLGSPGANDNGSGVAALLELARLLKDQKLDRTVRFVAFVNEEPPFYYTEEMGSRVYAARVREGGEHEVVLGKDSIGRPAGNLQQIRVTFLLTTKKRGLSTILI